MPTYKRFEDVPVWKVAIDLGLKIFALTDDQAFNYQGDLRSQLRRAALSVSNNIAEGFERGTTNELLNFLYIARGSAGEVRSMLIFTERMKRVTRASNADHLKSQISNLKSLAESCSRQLRGWADSLQNTDIKGQRHLNEATQSAFVRSKRAADFLEKLQQVRDGEDVRDVFAGALSNEDENS